MSVVSLSAAWEPVRGGMLTKWGEQLSPLNAWREYPRPAFGRDNWVNLNGLWHYAVTPADAADMPTSWTGEILVPFAIESTLSGVGRRVGVDEALWYQREFEIAVDAGKRVLLNFEAVDYHATVWVNGIEVGDHTGGFQPFAIDITGALRAGKNTVIVRVLDATDAEGAYQLHGKQVTSPRGIWYTPVTGIWQTVWLEQVPAAYLDRVKLVPHTDGRVTIELFPGGSGSPDLPVTISAALGGRIVASAEGSGRSFELQIPDPRLWSPDQPTLYDLEIRYGSDRVKTYVGLREMTVVTDVDGHRGFALNGQPIFPFGTLDQGWWPDGLLTPPSDEAMRSDVAFLKAAGFNTIRKHIKIEPRRYYTHCDQMGMLVWQDQVSSGTGKQREVGDSSPPWTRLQPDPVDAVWPPSAHAQFMIELRGMIDLLHNHPSIVQWVPFNEAWGQHRTQEVGDWTAHYDPTRQVNVASGGNFYRAGHIVDAHHYPHPSFPFESGQDDRLDGFVKVIGEFGGHGFPVDGHLWNSEARNWGYGGLPKDKAEWLERYRTSMILLSELKQKGIAAGIYTQTTDVEGEVNGLLTYDRAVQKISAPELAAIHRDANLTP